ncbi:protein dachsous [Patella vulgata]|uniref:protein dachsous n=1 Tax=Patella vulgata TaxID=6465 RepID=UPI00217F6E8A|nr:protein dachsous [Patella vulgata]
MILTMKRTSFMFQIIFCFVILICNGCYSFLVCERYGHNIEISEASPIGSVVYDLNCTDTSGSGLEYTIKSGNKYGHFGITDGIMSLNKMLNADGLTRKNHLKIIVQSTGPSVFSTTLTIAVLAINSNGHPPRFESITPAVTLPENTEVGTKLPINCVVKDKDFTPVNTGIVAAPGLTEVRIKNSEALEHFLLDKIKCELYLNAELDFETQATHVIIIEAYDLDPTFPKTVSETVTISVTDVNDNSPKCADSTRLVQIPEDQPIDTTIAVLNCSDIDSASNGVVNYKLSSNNSANVFQSFKLDVPEMSHLQLLKPLDYESSSSYKVKVEIYDSGNPSLTTTVEYNIIVTDVDDNKPTWPVSPIHAGSITELQPLGYLVYTVKAEDADLQNTPASSITYGMYPSVPNWFSIQSETGAIYVNSAMDWLVAKSVNLTVYAYSSDKTTETSDVDVTITITDVNNIAPAFEEVYYYANLTENSSPGTTLFTVKATDPESGVNGEFEYYIDSTVFEVNAVGVVSVASSVDYEAAPSYSFSIEAKDKGTPSLSGHSFLLINILPVNEHSPVIIEPPGPIDVPEDIAPGVAIFNFTVTDGDAGPDGEVTLAVLDPFGPFIIEPKTGVLSLRNSLDRETKPQWEVIVIARDKSVSDSKSSSVAVTINLSDVNDNNPICEPLTSTSVIFTDAIGKELATISCTDADEGGSANFEYIKESGDDKDAFVVDKRSGKITLDKPPTQTDYTLTIRVNDVKPPSRHVDIFFSIAANFQFNFTNLPMSINISENTETTNDIYEIDSCCVSGFTRYEIISGNDDKNVILDPSSGKLILLKEFDYEAEIQYTFTIQAESASTGMKIDDTLTINILDVNDVKPKFTNNFIYQPVSESLATSTVILQVTAIDKEKGANGEITYTIESGNDGPKFDIDGDGSLILVSALDAETVSQYVLKILATDNGDVPLTGTTTVVIEVKNVDEFPPEFLNVDNGIAVANISEQAILGAAVFTLRAEDKDVNSVLKYSILQGNEDENFVIDGDSGDIYLSKILDREMVDQYNLTVEVKTGNGENTSAVIVVNVLDANDISPTFSQPFYQLEVTHGTPADTVIYTFNITDADIGVNGILDSLTIEVGNNNNDFKIVGKEIRTNKEVDYYTTKLHSLTLKATDGGVLARSSFVPVVIKVLRIVEPPKFVVTEHKVNVREDESINSAVYDLHATPDGGIKYSIKSGNVNSAFYISESDGTIHVGSNLDFEKTEQYVLDIEAESRENVSLLASATVTINIVNVNDNVPAFTSTIYKFNVDEDAVPNESIGTVMATDLDKPPYGSITFGFAATSGSSDFTIGNDGEIKVNKALDYRRQNAYNIPVIADDGVRKGEALLVISVNDINDNTPTFTPDNVSIAVAESMPTGQVFYTAKAQDLDSGTNGEMEYRLELSSTEFSLNPMSGALTFNTPVDRETRDIYNLVIVAADKDVTSPKTGTLHLKVVVTDINDHEPVFSKTSQTVTINRTVSPGTILYTVTATDKDIGENAAIDFQISNGNTDDYFLIDTSSGEIKTALNLTAAENEYKLEITVKDKGIPIRSSTMIVNVLIIPVNSGVASEQNMAIYEAVDINTKVDDVKLKSGHTGAADLKYSIIGGNYKSSFQIDPTSGALFTSAELDREEYELFFLTIDITDTNEQYTKSVSITILDVNDNSPKIKALDTNIAVVENTPANQIITKFQITDEDIGTNGEADLILAETPAKAKKHFKIDGDSLVIKEPLDYETTKSITFEIFAVDRGIPKATGTIQVTVNIIDVPDDVVFLNGEKEAPSAYITREMSSNVEIGDAVTTITPEEFNISLTTGSITYTSINNEGIFDIDNNSGKVTVQKPDLIESNRKYFIWLAVSTENNGIDTNRLGLIRIDTFDPNEHIVSMESPETVDSLKAKSDTLLAKLSTFFTVDDVPKIWKTESTSSGSRILLYVMKRPASTKLADTTTPSRVFTDMDTMLSEYRLNPNEDIPKAVLEPPITAVGRYSEPLKNGEAAASKQEEFVSSENGFITFGMLSVLLIMLAILLIGFLIYKKKKAQQKRSDSSENLMPPEPAKAIRKIEIVKPPPKSNKKKKPSSDNEESPANRTTRKTSIGPAATAMPTTHKNRKTSSLQAPPENELPPVQTPKLDRPPPVIAEKKPGEKTSVVTKRKNGPVVHRGKEYDGVAYDADKQQRYAYNTRTGSTLWMEKENNLGSGKDVHASKKKPTPVLTVVSEARNESPNFGLNRSVKMTSNKN